MSNYSPRKSYNTTRMSMYSSQKHPSKRREKKTHERKEESWRTRLAKEAWKYRKKIPGWPPWLAPSPPNLQMRSNRSFARNYSNPVLRQPLVVNPNLQTVSTSTSSAQIQPLVPQKPRSVSAELLAALLQIRGSQTPLESNTSHLTSLSTDFQQLRVQQQ